MPVQFSPARRASATQIVLSSFSLVQLFVVFLALVVSLVVALVIYPTLSSST